MTDHQQHYKNLSGDFDNLWYFTSDYRQWMMDRIISTLELTRNDRFVDLGGGSGLIAEMVYQRVKPENPVLCADPCEEMLKDAKERNGVNILKADDILFSTNDEIVYNKLLIKEAIHHFKDRMRTFKNLYHQLKDGGRVLLITRPQKTDFPFFEKGHDAFKESQPPENMIIDQMKNAGFEVTRYIYPFLITMSKIRWFYMLKNRFMSHLYQISDSELENGIKELEEKFFRQETLRFNDNLLFIVGVRTCSQ